MLKIFYQKKGDPSGDVKTLRVLSHNLLLDSEELTRCLEFRENNEISTNYFMNGRWWNQNKVNIDNFLYKI